MCELLYYMWADRLLCGCLSGSERSRVETVLGEPKGSWESEVQRQQLCLSTQVQVHQVL